MLIRNRATNLSLMQQAFGEAVIGESPHAALEWIEGTDGLAKERLFVYRRNCLSSLVECIKGRYPRTREALGGQRFDALAQEFVLAHPPEDEALINYGAGFVGVLKSSERFKPSVDQEEEDRNSIATWLPELALLELYWHQSYHEREEAHLEMSALSKVAAEKLDSVAFECHATLRSLTSQFDLLVPWNDPTAEPPRLMCELLVVRKRNMRNLYRLESGFGEFFEALRSGASMAQAFELAPGEQEFSEWLATLLSWGVFSSAPST